MIETRDSVSGVLDTDSPSVGERPRGPNRRKFLGQVATAATFAAGAVASPSVSSAQAIGGTSNSPGSVAPPAGVNNSRVMEAFELRVAEANQDAAVPAAVNVNNGDETRYPDKGGTYTKGLKHDDFGRVDPLSYQTFRTALNSGEFSDFENIIMGGTRTLNGPQGGLCFCLDALDNAQFGQPQVPPECHRTPRTLLGILAARCRVHGLSFEPLGRYGSGRTRVSADIPRATQQQWSGHAGSALPGRLPGRNTGALPLSVLHSAHLLRLATHRPAASHLSAEH